MKKLYIRKETDTALRLVRQKLPQSLLLSGPAGVGLRTIAEDIGKSYGSFEIVRPTKRTKTSTMEQIGIEQIRELYERTRSKRTGAQIIVIDDADAMSLPAQNSFLKLLEEPNTAVHFILTSHHPELLLPTIRSRLQTIPISALSPDATTKLIATEYPSLDAAKQTQLLFIAAGLPAEIERLMADEVYFDQMTARMQLVRTLLEGARYERLKALYKASFSKPEALRLIESLLLVLKRQPTPDTLQRIKRLLGAYERIQANGNPRLQLISAML